MTVAFGAGTAQAGLGFSPMSQATLYEYTVVGSRERLPGRTSSNNAEGSSATPTTFLFVPSVPISRLVLSVVLL